jgi:hypothetical protein
MGPQESPDGGVFVVQRADLLASFWTRKRPMLANESLISMEKAGACSDTGLSTIGTNHDKLSAGPVTFAAHSPFLRCFCLQRLTGLYNA